MSGELPADTVRSILAALAGGTEGQTEIARRHRVSQGTVSSINTGASWARVEGPPRPVRPPAMRWWSRRPSLSAETVRSIRRALATGTEMQTEIAARHGTTVGTVSQISRGRTYRWVDADETGAGAGEGGGTSMGPRTESMPEAHHDVVGPTRSPALIGGGGT